MAYYSQVYDLRYYNGILCEITMHHWFKLCGLITCYSTSRSGNSMSPALIQFSITLSMLGSDMGPYPCR
jgi:hypothetical protein